MTQQYTGDKPKWIEFITPVGRIWKCFIDKPYIKTDMQGRKVLDDDGIAVAEKQIGLMWTKQELDTTLIPFRTQAAQARDQKWPPGSYDPNFFAMEPFLRDGDNPTHNTKGRADLRGMVYMTFKQKLKPARLQTGEITYTGAPGIIGPYNEDLLVTDIYAGAFCRVSGILFGTEHSGRRFISVRLNNIQKGGGIDGLGNGERIAGGPPDARSQFDPLMAGPMPTQGGFGAAPLLGAPQPQFPAQQLLAPTGLVNPQFGQGGNGYGQDAARFTQPGPYGQQGYNQFGAPQQPGGLPRTLI